MAAMQQVDTLRSFLIGEVSVAFSPDGRLLAAGSNGQEAVKLWDTETRQEVLTLGGEGSFFFGLKFSPDGRYLLAVSYVGLAHLWSAPTWAERIDALANTFSGQISGVYSTGFQPIIIPVAGQGIQLAITSLAGVAVPANPAGVLGNPDVIIPGVQANPIPVVVQCSNIPLNTPITVLVQPAYGAAPVQAGGFNNTGTEAASTATVMVNMPRGGGVIYAQAVIAVTGGSPSAMNASGKSSSYAQTGLTADGERFAKIEVKAALGGRQELTGITPSGTRCLLASR
jgi:hypothetical protein